MVCVWHQHDSTYSAKKKCVCLWVYADYNVLLNLETWPIFFLSLAEKFVVFYKRNITFITWWIDFKESMLRLLFLQYLEPTRSFLHWIEATVRKFNKTLYVLTERKNGIYTRNIFSNVAVLQAKCGASRVGGKGCTYSHLVQNYEQRFSEKGISVPYNVVEKGGTASESLQMHSV